MQHADTYGALLHRHALAKPDAIALRFAGRDTRFDTLDTHVNAVANALLASGVTKGDRIAYLGKNSDLAVELTLGAARAGVVFVPVIWRLASPEVERILEDSGARMLFVEPAFAGNGKQAEQRGLAVVLMAEEAAYGWSSFTAWRDSASSTTPPVHVTPEDLVLLLYTSGTTGTPKGVMLSHANGTSLRAGLLEAGIDWVAAGADEAVLVAMPYGHIAGVGSVLNAVQAGQEMVILAEFDPGEVLKAIQTHRIPRLFLVPAAIRLLLDHPDQPHTDLSSVRVLGYGASPIPIELLRRTISLLGCGLTQFYGMTETWGTVVALPPEDHRPGNLSRLSAAGKALPGVELRILDTDGRELPVGATGEVAIRSAANTRGYWNRPEETRRALTSDGWLRTGDAGRRDHDGYLFILDRVKDMIISGAENVYPAEVESAIYGHPDVADVAVIGVPDPVWGEAVKACVVLRAGACPDAASVIAWARERIAGFKCPKTVDFVESLPRNPSGKILRRQLREPYWPRGRQIN